MSEERDVADRFVRLLDARDWEQWASLLHPDVVYEMPQTRERLVGRDRYVQFNQEYPGDWRLEARVVVVDAARAAVMLRCTVGADEPLDAIVFLEVVRGLIVKLTDFWPERYDPPPGREHLTERFWTPAAPPTLMRMQTNASPDEPQRLAMHKVVPDLYKAHLALDSAVARAGIDPLLHELIKIRASQLNGCAYCLDMHTQDARALGESEQRLHLLAAWREAPLYSARERAALALTEAVTLIAGAHVPDDVWDAAAATFEPAEVGALIMAIVAINGWNRIAIAGGARAGTYRSKLSPPTSNAAG